jgi:hypothetical protein
MKAKDRSLRVWIELPHPVDEAHAIELCAYANKMLSHLPIGPCKKFGWDTERMQYTYSHDGNTYYRLVDRGHWFNLKALAGEDE